MQKSTSKGSNYKLYQVFGYKGPNERIMEEDIISSIKFDQSGKFLSLGDKAGRIIVFECPNQTPKKDIKFQYYAEFQSHSRQFDPLRSVDIEEEILDIVWMKSQDKYLKLLTTNAKTIKLWKAYDKIEKKIVKNAGKDLSMPKIQNSETNFITQVQKQFPNKHLTSINSISPTSNEQYLLSSDEAQTFLWNFQKSDKPFVVADILNGQKVEDAKENITCSKIHPSSDSIFLYGTNKGFSKMMDMRNGSTDKCALSFKVQSSSQKSNFLTEMVSSISSLELIKGGKYIVSRDFLTVKVWDICNTKKPINSIPVHDSLKSKICEIFENDNIFDKFKTTCSPDGNTILTGNYNNSFHLIDPSDSSNTQFDINYKKQTVSRPILPNKSPQVNKMDYLRKTLACDFHPKKNMLTVASLNCFFIYGM